MDYSPPGWSVHWILQARVLEWVAMHALVQGIFLIQGLSLGLLPFRRIPRPTEPQGKHCFANIEQSNVIKIRLLCATLPPHWVRGTPLETRQDIPVSGPGIAQEIWWGPCQISGVFTRRHAAALEAEAVYEGAVVGRILKPPRDFCSPVHTPCIISSLGVWARRASAPTPCPVTMLQWVNLSPSKERGAGGPDLIREAL